MEKIIYVINFLLFIYFVKCQNIPANPCPNIFGYNFDGEKYYGTIQIPSPPFGSSLKLMVGLSLRAQLPSQDVGSLELAYTRQVALQRIINGQPTQYRIRFPIPSPLPKVTSIVSNSQVICSGPPERGQVVTQIRLEHVLYTEGAATQQQLQQQQQQQQQFSNGQDDNNNFFNSDFDNNNNFNNFNNFNTNNNNNNFNNNNQQFDNGNFINQQNLLQQPAFNPQPQLTQNNQNQRPQQTTQQTQPQSWQPMGSNVQRPIMMQPRPQTTQPPQTQRPETQRPEPNTGSDAVINTLPDEDICGTADSRYNVAPLVVGGAKISRGAWPWLAALYTTDASSSLSFKCGGNLVSKRVVVTAAHCIQKGSNVYAASEVIVYLGRYNIRKWDLEEGSVIRETSVLAAHPDYMKGNSPTFDADIAVIVLKTVVTYSQYIRPICLWSGSPDKINLEGQVGTVVGWGRDENGQVTTPEPKKIQVPIVSDSDCLRSGETFRQITSNRTFCAGSRDGTGPCNGDSGSGLALNWHDKWTLRGLVSVATSDPVKNICNLKEFVVFTDAAKFTDWVKMFMSL